MNPKVLSTAAWQVVRKVTEVELQLPWVLAGGTGLALQLGHRVSMDLDFFADDPFDVDGLRAALGRLGRLEIQAQEANTLHARLDGLRLSYLRSEAPFLFERIAYRGLQIADVRDIAAMKIIAIAGQGSRKDFVDLYSFMAAGGDFPGLMEVVRRRYTSTTFNEVHLLRSLVFFDDAEKEPMPRMLHPVTWKDIRSRLEDEVRRWAP